MKQVRPISVFKRKHPDRYALAMLYVEATSKKEQENSFYRIYARWVSGIPWNLNETKTSIQWNPFFFNDQNREVNNSIVTEMGRLLLTGWYYGIQPFTVEVCGYVYKSYLKKSEEFNELEFTRKLKHIRENIGFYYHSPQELKLFILESFFSDELTPMLPEKPEILQIVEVAHKAEQADKAQHDKDYYFNLTCEQQEYIDHLHQVLKLNCIPFQSFENFTAERERQHQEFIKECKEVHQAYRDGIRKIDINNLLPA